MELHKILYFNSFSLGSLIAIVFFILTSFYLLSIRKKSEATFHLGVGYALLAVFNFGYFIAASIDHPLAAFHRWITVSTILLVISHFNAFYFFYAADGDRYRKTARVFLRVSYGVSLALTLLFFVMTATADRVFIFNAHTWDFDADRISEVFGVAIISYIMINLSLSIWRLITQKSRERWIIFLIGVTFLAATLVPAVANTLSRDGLLDRDVFQNTWVMFNVLGFFLLLIIYVNNTRDRITFIATLIGICLVTILTMLQFLSFYSLRERDQSFDDIHRKSAKMALSDATREDDVKYMVSYLPGKDAFEKGWEKAPIDPESIKQEMINTYILDAIGAIGPDNFRADLADVLDRGGVYFEGYRQIIAGYIAGKKGGALSAAELNDYIDGLRKQVLSRSKTRGSPASR